MRRTRIIKVALVAATIVIAGCGSSAHHQTPAQRTQAACIQYGQQFAADQSARNAALPAAFALSTTSKAQLSTTMAQACIDSGGVKQVERGGNTP